MTPRNGSSGRRRGDGGVGAGVDDRSRARGVGVRLKRTADGRAVRRPPTAAAAQAVDAQDDADHRTMGGRLVEEDDHDHGCRPVRPDEIADLHEKRGTPADAGPVAGCALRLCVAVSRVAVQCGDPAW
ncbi:hypothetical protein ACFUKV_04450 [Streptomyces paradoxus]|uniref:hypothetical protein n=1 Tax=Streptomyces paradoxus TaxID=66375 RepID=UPI003624E86D